MSAKVTDQAVLRSLLSSFDFRFNRLVNVFLAAVWGRRGGSSFAFAWFVFSSRRLGRLGLRFGRLWRGSRIVSGGIASGIASRGFFGGGRFRFPVADRFT